MDSAGLPALIDAIQHLHGLHAKWLQSVPVFETLEGRPIWAGEVQVFEVKHPNASRVYAWSSETGAGNRQFHAVLGADYIDSPEKAVHAEVASNAKKSTN